MGLKLKAAPAQEPVSLGDAKDHLRVTTSAEDQRIQDFLVAAREHLEGVTRRQLVTATYELTLDRFPRSSDDVAGRFHAGQPEIELPRPPLRATPAVVVQYYDAEDALQTLSATAYEVDVDVEPGVVRLKADQSWPATKSKRNAVKITYTAGYGDPASVPERAKAAIRLHLAHLYEHREAWTEAKLEEVPLGWRELAWSLRWGLQEVA